MRTMFDKSPDLFPVKHRYVFLSHCGVSPLHAAGLAREQEMAREQSETGSLIFDRYEEILERLRATGARLLQTDPQNVSFHRNSSEAISMIASGYPFEPGDQVISYVHEYPANHYPWRLQARRGVELIELPNICFPGTAPCGDRPCAFAFEELERRVTKRTRVIALSHVQFTSGFALDLQEVGELCRAHGIDLVLDAAQSLGLLPVYPDTHHVSAVISSGWKWLLGPIGTGLMYTSPEFRNRLEPVMIGAEAMEQGEDYLDHAWRLHRMARRFEYSTASLSLAAALEACIAEVQLRHGVEALRDEVFRLQDVFLERVDRRALTPMEFPARHRSGILAVLCHRQEPEKLVIQLRERGFICSARGGYLRVAPHFYLTDEDIHRFTDTLNRLGTETN